MQTGSRVTLQFKGQHYHSVYKEFMALIWETLEHEYHGPKLMKLFHTIAHEG
jgi:hypothetical protein